jgi:lipid-binding SYLF domain-containing protein
VFYVKRFSTICALLLPAACLPTIVNGQSPQDALVQSATNVLNEIMAVPAKQIPQSMLADAHGIAVIPNVIKGGFVVGVRHGKGIVVVRDPSGGWRPPMFLSMTGGSVGWQAGLQSTDVVLVFKSQKSIDGLMSGKFTVGADAAAAAGPVGRQASAATDTRLGAEIYSYSRSRGLFAGVSLDGSALQIEAAENQAYYGGVGPDGVVSQIPPSAVGFLQTISKYTASNSGEAAPQAVMAAPTGGFPSGLPATPAPAAVAATPTDADVLRQQLATASRRLEAIVDDNWKRYLALPPSIYTGGASPPLKSMNDALDRFNAVTRDARYAALAQHPDFRQTLALLQTYVQQAGPASQPGLLLPPPPGQAGATPLPTPRY